MLWALITLAITSIPLPAIAAPPGADKGVHWILYFVLGVLSARAVLANRNARVAELLVVLAAILVFGAVDELHQYWIPGRSVDFRDWVADVVGALSGMVLVLVLARRRAPRAPRAS
jgi:VanZ family protein